MNEKLTWRLSEVIAFIEDRIIYGIATEEEELIYENYKWNNKINKNTYEFKCILKEMRNEYNGGY